MSRGSKISLSLKSCLGDLFETSRKEERMGTFAMFGTFEATVPIHSTYSGAPKLETSKKEEWMGTFASRGASPKTALSLKSSLGGLS